MADDDIIIPDFSKGKKAKVQTKGWTPPVINDDPPVQEDKPEEPGIISKVWNKLNTPLVDVSPQTKAAMSSFSQDHPVIGKVGELATGAMTGMSSPLGLGLGAVTGGAALAEKAGASGLASALRVPGKIASGGMVAHGGANAIGNIAQGNYGQAIGNVAEAGIGALGLRGGLKASEPLGEIPPAPEMTPVDAVKRWGYARNWARQAGVQAKDRFSALSEPGLVDQYEAGNRSDTLPDVENFHKDYHQKLVGAGVLGEDQARPNYLRHYWDQPADNTVRNSSGVTGQAGLSKPSLYQNYAEGIAKGETPKFNNIPDIAGAYSKEAEEAIADKQLKEYLGTKGINLEDASISDPQVQKRIGKLDPEAQKLLANYFSKSPIGGVADAASATKNIALAQGVPTRTGTLSAHGFNLLGSDTEARGFGPAIKDFISRTVSPQKDVEFIQQNKPYLERAIKSGLNWSGDAYSEGTVDDAVKKIPVLGKAKELQDKFLSDPLFKVRAPAMQLKMYVQKYNELLKTVDPDTAAKSAAQFANDFSGTVDKTFRNKTYQDIARTGLLAPDWLESRINIAKKGLTGQPGYVAPLARGTAVAAAPAIAGIASKGIGKYIGGKPAEVTGISAGSSGNKERNIEPLGTSIEPQRTALQVGSQLAQGNLTYPFKYGLKNKLSPPVSMLNDLMNNQDVYGNAISGKNRFGKPIPAGTAAANVAQEVSRPLTPGIIQALIDMYRGKGTGEEVLSKGAGLPITYTQKKKGS